MSVLALRHGIVIGLWAFGMAALAGLASQLLVKELTLLLSSFAVLLGVIAIGVVFDVIGVAVAAADESPLHSRCSTNVFGARQAVSLVQNAHHVASFCNDVVGDVSGTLSGAIGITVVYQILTQPSPLAGILATTAMTATVAALVVGGKAYGKVYAIENGTEIIFHVGQLLAVVERVRRWILRHPPRKEKKHSRNGNNRRKDTPDDLFAAEEKKA